MNQTTSTILSTKADQQNAEPYRTCLLNFPAMPIIAGPINMLRAPGPPFCQIVCICANEGLVCATYTCFMAATVLNLPTHVSWQNSITVKQRCSCIISISMWMASQQQQTTLG